MHSLVERIYCLIGWQDILAQYLAGYIGSLVGRIYLLAQDILGYWLKDIVAPLLAGYSDSLVGRI